MRFEVADQVVQAHRQAGDQLAAHLRVARQFGEHRVLRDVQQAAVGQRLRHQHVGALHEHHRLAESLAGADDLDHLLVAVLGDEGKLDLAFQRQVEAVAGIALVEQDVALVVVLAPAAGGEAQQVVGAQPGKQRRAGQDLRHFEQRRVAGDMVVEIGPGNAGHHGFTSSVGRRTGEDGAAAPPACAARRSPAARTGGAGSWRLHGQW
ncbi:hypothetical protein SDC9_163289 [bioreactor metagenome]|uniref:Uncharacterized protein n=1 Tax=bioreactor metagenome TaxID=1076179 RepID=A0A645FV74_9ZZZZ